MPTTYSISKHLPAIVNLSILQASDNVQKVAFYKLVWALKDNTCKNARQMQLLPTNGLNKK